MAPPSRWGPRKSPPLDPSAAHSADGGAVTANDGVNGSAGTPEAGDLSEPAPASNGSTSNPSTNPLARLEILDSKAALKEDGVEKVDAVEWGPGKHEDGYDTDQTLAPRPRAERPSDPCGCQTPDVLLDEEQPQTTTLEELIKLHQRCKDDTCLNHAMREECRYNCEAADFCGNKRLQNKEFIPAAVINAGPKGRGLAVLTDCKKGDFLCEYVGQAISNKALPKLFRRYQHERRLYIMGLDDKTYIDARQMGGVARFINHSCNPNAKVERWKVKGVLRAVVVAMKGMSKGSEVTFDYQWQRQRGRALTKCYCKEPMCRGTLEQQAQTIEEQNEKLQKQREHQQGNEEKIENLPDGSWLKGVGVSTKDSPEVGTYQHPDQTLVNRAIRVLSKEHQEYFVGEVVGYNEENGKHQVLYQNDWTEVWEDLNQEDWMVLVEENPNQNSLSISRKVKRMTTGKGGSSIADKEADNSRLIAVATKPTKNYVYVQTPVKEALRSRHLIERCERNCHVQITPTSHGRPPLLPNPDDPEDVEKFAALDQSKDGVVWKLTISGGDIFRAQTILGKNVSYVKRLLDDSAPTRQLDDTKTISPPTEQVLYPRMIADAVKRKLPQLRDKCRNVSISFAASENTTKQFSRLILEGGLPPEIEHAKVQIWNVLVALCVEYKAPMTIHEIPYNMGFLAGELAKDQLGLMGVSLSSPISSGQKTASSESRESYELSPFFKSFESTYRCTIWVESDDDVGRIDSTDQVVGDATSTKMIKMYIGCNPKDIVVRWGQIQARLSDLERGVRFIHLGRDRIYQPLMTKDNSEFFGYVFSVTGASVGMDTLTGDHLKVDGRSSIASPSVLSPEVRSLDEKEKACLAEEIVRLQIEIYRDHFTKQQEWVFGRDWTLASQPVQATGNSSRTTKGAIGRLDTRMSRQCCMEIAEVVSRMGLERSTGAHAAIILYRFLSLENSPEMKAREAVLACAFLANKAQKDHKWRRIDAVVKAGYATFYPGTDFDPQREDVLMLEERVVAVEQEILDKLDYDVFFQDAKWLTSLVHGTAGGTNPDELIGSITNLSFSGQVLGAGSELWLNYGIEYVLAAAAALHIDLQSLLPLTSLIPLKVQRAAELLVEHVKFGKPSSSGMPSHPSLEKSRASFIDRLKYVCSDTMKVMPSPGAVVPLPESAGVTRRYRLIAEESQRRFCLRGISPLVIREKILPNLDKITADSGCTVFIDPSPRHDTCNLVLVGSWRAIAVAEHAMVSFVSPVAGAESFNDMAQTHPILHSKSLPGMLATTSEIQTSEEWNGTKHSMAWAYDKGVRLGGKSCVAARISLKMLGSSGLRWWIPKQIATGSSGTISSTLFGRAPTEPHSKSLATLASAYLGDMESYPILSLLGQGAATNTSEAFVAVSLQQWPPEKVSSNELKKAKAKKQKRLGFSPAALQEMQLLTRLHRLIDSPRGHPNFILPFGIAIPQIVEPSSTMTEDDEDLMFSLFKSTEENEHATQKDKKVKESPQLVFDPSPFVLPRFLSKKNGVDDLLAYPVVVTSWFHDLISLLAHCHSNNVILRSLLTDQIVISSGGVAKISGLYRCTVLNPSDGKDSNPLKLAKRAADRSKRKGSKGGDDNDDELTPTATTAPELLLGCPRQSMETDVWMVGCILAHLLLGKPLFTGKGRTSFLISQYKIVGSPSSKNYEQGVRFPNYEKITKKYKRGVEKAFGHMMNDGAAEKYVPHIDLIAAMLHLDPAQRCSAAEAMQHPCLVEFAAATAQAGLRTKYAQEWTELKETLLKSQEDRSESKRHQKRKAMLISAAGTNAGGDADDLYDLDDLLEPAKNIKTG
jgi:serine/threonine protein kinase